MQQFGVQGAKPFPLKAQFFRIGVHLVRDEHIRLGNQVIQQVWGGANSGLDGGNDNGKGITDAPGPLKLQCEGHDVRYRNAWIKELDLTRPNTDFKN